MKRYPKDYNPIIEYFHLMDTGQIVVCDYIYTTFKHLYHKCLNPGKYFYSNARANHFFEFAENFCRLSQGKKGMQLVELELWEKAFLGAIFGFIDENGIRQYKEACLIIGRKNGKSLIASLVGNYMLIADGEAGPEVVSAATKKDQAKKVWQPAKQMILQSPTLRKYVRPLVSSLHCDRNFGEFKYLSSDADTLDGLNLHCVLFDEMHQMKNGKPLYDTLSDGMGGRDQPLFFITTTAGTVREDIYDLKFDEYVKIINGYKVGEEIDERRIGFIYTLDDRKEWENPDCWVKANPGLGTIKPLHNLKEMVDRAKENPALVKNVLCKQFNIRETSDEAWLSFDIILNEATFDIGTMKPDYGIFGLDLSDTTDLTCATILFRVPNNDTIYIEQMYWLPADRLEEHIKTDKVPYDEWVRSGHVRLCEGNRINYNDVIAWFNEMLDKYDIYAYKIGYDSWNAKFIVDELEMLAGKEGTIAVRQGAQTFSNPLKAFKAELASKKVNYNNNPVLRWCLSNAKVSVDRNDNFALIKTSNASKRIDGVASLMDAFIVYENHKDEYLSVI